MKKTPIGITPLADKFNEVELRILRHLYSSIQELMEHKRIKLNYISATYDEEKIEFAIDELLNREI